MNRDHHAKLQSDMAYVTRGDLGRGLPVPGTGKQAWRSAYTNRRAGVSSGILSRERHLPHRYMDEGDKGPKFRRQLRRISEAAWRREVNNY